VSNEVQTKQGAAAELIRELLADGPMRPCDVRAEAERRGMSFDVQTWERAKREAGIEASGSGRTWWWSLPGSDVEHEFYAWLDSNQGRFENYCAARDRLAQTPAGEQLDLL
jgi:hypothetical protein